MTPQRRLQLKRISLVRALKAARGCLVCGTKNPAVLDFEHRDPAAKDPRLRRNNRHSSGVGWIGLSFANIRAEAEKCDVMCSNHHRIRQAWQRRMAVI